ncbi:probable mannose-1-phosphate guanylyltransferase 3 [Phtheirospermum japonicum]|uniref:Probable mannose-1-phosphate guanylyltransferase 3 n=1 Tax=Phtheirospermum japonicum TaxID=374723 RepID=A0A830C198_9LAMI|nr:probable mannose-1-phosphate guanylyltransferase 3 [Phtheirospermum japonicum]
MANVDRERGVPKHRGREKTVRDGAVGLLDGHRAAQGLHHELETLLRFLEEEVVSEIVLGGPHNRKRLGGLERKNWGWVSDRARLCCGVRLCRGVRREACLVARLCEAVRIKKHVCISRSIIGWHSTVGHWARVENMTILGEDVHVGDEVYSNGGVVFPHKEIKTSILKSEILM